MSRILTWSRIFEPAFGWTLAHCVVNIAPITVALMLLVFSLAQRAWPTSLVILLGLLAHTFLLCCSYGLVRRAVTHSTVRRGEKLQPLAWYRWIKLFFLIPITLVVYVAAMLRALTTRYVCWRGVWYYVYHRSRVILLAYQPYAPQCEDDSTLESTSI